MKKIISFLLLSTFAILCSNVIGADPDVERITIGGDTLCHPRALVKSKGTVINTGVNYKYENTITIETPDGCSATLTISTEEEHYQVRDEVRFTAQIRNAFGKVTNIELVNTTCEEIKFHHDSFTYQGGNKYTWGGNKLQLGLDQIKKFRKEHNKANTTFSLWSVCYNNLYTVEGMTYLGPG